LTLPGGVRLEKENLVAVIHYYGIICLPGAEFDGGGAIVVDTVRSNH
jgi:hypothetical protein